MKSSFGMKCSQLRKEKKLTQEQLAERLNVTSQAVSKWENDLSYPDVELLVDLAKLFDCSVDYLLGKEDTPETRLVPEEERRDLNQMLLKIIVLSKDGDKVKVNLPLGLVRVGLEIGMQTPQLSGSNALKNIDFEQVLKMAEQGMIGKIVEVESADGDTVEVYIE